MQKTDHTLYDNKTYYPGASALKRVLWYYVSVIVFRSGLFPISALKVAILRLFGARLGKNCVIKPYMTIKYPWFFTAGDEAWIGEHVTIDNLVMVTFGHNVCISQHATIITGSHNYLKTTFDLIMAPVELEDGVWICAGAMLTAGVTAGSHAVLAAGSVASTKLDAFSIYKGNPAVKIRARELS